MQCPKCNDAPLTPTTIKGRPTEVDYCKRCRGIWFDDGELAEVLGSPVDPCPTPPAAARPQTDVACPRCNEPLSIFCYPGTFTVVEMCPSCSGMWLDDAELQEIAKVRSAKRRTMDCPKCGFSQAETESCARCGVVFAKLRHQAEGGDHAAQSSTSPANAAGVAPATAVDQIPGIKGTLLRFIESSIQGLLGAKW